MNKQWIRLAALGVAAVTVLAGCHRPLNGKSRGGYGQGAQTQGFSDEASYSSVAVHRASDGRIVNPLKAPTSQTYYFSFDDSHVEGDDFTAIRMQAQYLAAHPAARVRLEGNTDDVGSREYNIALGWRRDQAIARILKQYGARRSQLIMVSYGKEKPAQAGMSQRVRLLNRRVHLVYEAY